MFATVAIQINLHITSTKQPIQPFITIINYVIVNAQRLHIVEVKSVSMVLLSNHVKRVCSIVNLKLLLKIMAQIVLSYFL